MGSGLIFVNLDASPKVAELEESKTDKLARNFGVSDASKWVEGWEIESNCNWKLAGESIP